MPKWKLDIFVNAIKTRMATEGRTAEDIIFINGCQSSEERDLPRSSAY